MARTFISRWWGKILPTITSYGNRAHSYGHFLHRAFSYKIRFLQDGFIPDVSPKNANLAGNFSAGTYCYIVKSFLHSSFLRDSMSFSKPVISSLAVVSWKHMPEDYSYYEGEYFCVLQWVGRIFILALRPALEDMPRSDTKFCDESFACRFFNRPQGHYNLTRMIEIWNDTEC